MSLKKKSRKINRTTFHIFLLAGITTIVLTACTAPVAVDTALPTSIPTQAQLLETSTPFPTWTPRPTMTTAPTPTLDNISSLASDFDIPSVCLFTYLVSRDQNRIGADCKLYKELIIADRSSGNKIVVPYQEIDNEVPDNFSVSPLNWSSDNHYFYFTTRCCDYEDSSNSNGSLYRFDTEKESWNILVHGAYEPFYFFSDDGERYVFLNHYPSDNSGAPEHLETGMVDVLSNKSKRVVFRYLWGPLDDKPTFAWSKNNDRFAIVLYRPTFHPHDVSYNKEMLIIDFNKMDMELVEEFNRNNLLGEE